MTHSIGINQPLGGGTVNAPDWYQEFDREQVLLPYQSAWIADDAVIKFAEKSRRTGLTWAEAADATLCAGTARSAGGCNHFYVGSNKEMAREFIDAVAMWARAFNQAAGEIHEEIIEEEDKNTILTFVVNFASGFKVQALSSNPKNLRGMQGNVTIDEAAFHERLAEVLKAALALTMWGSKVRVISTHNGAENKFNELIQDARAGKKRYSIHRIPLKEACAQGLYQRICQITGKPWSSDAEKQWIEDLYSDTDSKEDAEEEYGCIPKAGGGAYISRALIESRTADHPVLRYEGSAEFNSWPEPVRRAEIEEWCEANLKPLLEKLNPVLRHALGEDFARSGDLTVMAPMAVLPNLKRQVPFHVELKNVPFKQQEQILKYICDRLPRFCKAKLDARGNGQYLAEAAKDLYGAGRVDEVMLSQAWYLENMPRFKAAFEDDGIEIPRDAETVSDLRAIQVIKGIPRIPEGNTNDTQTKKQRHGDAAVAYCLAYAASFEDGGEIDWTPAPSAKSQWDDIDNDHDFNFMSGGAW